MFHTTHIHAHDFPRVSVFSIGTMASGDKKSRSLNWSEKDKLILVERVSEKKRKKKKKKKKSRRESKRVFPDSVHSLIIVYSHYWVSDKRMFDLSNRRINGSTYLYCRVFAQKW